MMKKIRGSYADNGYTMIDRVLANCDKCSANGQSNVVNTPWGVIRMYRTSSKGRGRFYSVSGSKVIHNGGSYKIYSLRRVIGMVAK